MQAADPPLAGTTAHNRTGQSRAGRTQLWTRVKKHRWHYLFTAPMVVAFLAFTAWPMAASWWYALLDWPGYGPMDNFIGLANFREVVVDREFLNAAKNTGVFALFAIFVQMPLALFAAIVLNNAALRFRNVYRVLFFLPVVTTTAVVGVVFAIILDPVGGPINEFWLALPFTERPINFLGDERVALPTVLVIDMWKGIGVTIIYWLAALQTIPNELYEAARIDGANRRQILTRITIPLLVPLGLVILLLTFVTSLNAFDLIKVLTDGGPNRATDIVQTYIFRYAFDPEIQPRFGFASAAGIVFGLAVMVVTLMPALLRRRAGRRTAREREGVQ